MVYEKCGIVGIYSSSFTTLLPTALTAAGGVQHRGQQGTGIAVSTGRKILTYKGSGLVKQVFSSNVIKRLDQPSNWVLVHCRYGTFGNYASTNLQPCIIKTKNQDTIAVIHNGEFAQTNNFLSIIKKNTRLRLKDGVSDTYLFSLILSLSSGKNWDQKLISCLSQVKGAYSLIIAVNNTLYFVRDKFGIRPLIFGKLKNSWLAASETHAFTKVGATVIREINKGEIVKVDRFGIKTIKKEDKTGESHFCDFEWAYFSRPESRYPTYNKKGIKKTPSKWLSVSLFRERTGEILASESPIPNASFVVGIPDSGISVGTGYANALKIPYRQVVVRDHFDRNGIDRLFMRDDEMKRISRKVLGKLTFVVDERIWKDAVVIVADDSIVRGNVSSQITKAILSHGAKEVHWIIGFPPIVFRCHLGVSIRSGEELIATRHNGNSVKITKELGATSINYISPQGFIKARLIDTKITIPSDKSEIFMANGGCGGCITGLYPVSKDGSFYQMKKRKVLPKKKQLKLAILISGSGTTMETIIRSSQKGELVSLIKPVLVISSSKNALGVNKAKKQLIPVEIVERKNFAKGVLGEEKFGNELLRILEKYEVDIVSQNGWLPFTPVNVIEKYSGRIFNQHPGPLDPYNKNGQNQALHFGGKGMYGLAVHAAVLNFQKLVKRQFSTEATIHYVTPNYDQGDVILRRKVPVFSSDTPQTLAKRVLPIEHKLFTYFLKQVASGKLTVSKRSTPLVKKGEEEYFYKAIANACKKYPHG